MQDALFFDNANAALRHTVEACGGFKKVGPSMRPDKSPDMAAQSLQREFIECYKRADSITARMERLMARAA